MSFEMSHVTLETLKYIFNGKLHLITFVENYPDEDICYVMKLTSRFSTFINLTISILGNLNFIYFTIKTQSSTNESLLNNAVHVILFMGSSIVFPPALTLLIYQFSIIDPNELRTCDIQFLSRDNFTDAALILEIILTYR